jgi:WD40 repeat protein
MIQQLTGSKFTDCTFTRAPANVSSRSVSFAPQPPYLLAAASSCSAVRIFQELDGKELSVLTGHTAPVTSVQFGIEAVLASASVPDRTVRFWDVKANKCVAKIDAVAAMNLQWHTYNNDKTHEIAITERSGDINIYDIRKLPSVLHAIHLAPRIAECCTYYEDYIITGTTLRGSGMADLCVIDPQNTPQILFQCPSHAGPIYDMVITQPSTHLSSSRVQRPLLATGGADAVVSIWDVQTLTCIQAIASKTKYIRSLDFSSSGNILAIGTEEEILDLCQFDAGEKGHAPPQPGVGLGSIHIGGGIEAVCFHPQKEHVLACARSYYHAPSSREPSQPPAPANSPVTIVHLQQAQS